MELSTRRIKRDEVTAALWGGSVIKSVVITGTLTDEQRKALEGWLVSETKMWRRHTDNPALVHSPDGTAYSYVVLPNPGWTPAELGDTLKGWWEYDRGNLVGTVVEEKW